MALQHIFLANLKTDTHWYIKKIHLELLELYGKSWGGENLFYLALHLCNILKVSEVENIRRSAGFTLLKLVKGLKKEGLNDIAIELIRALEINDFKFVYNIPFFLSNIFVLLDEKEANEMLEDLSDKIRRKTHGITILHIQTTALSLSFLLEKLEKDNILNVLSDIRIEKLLRMLVSATYDSNNNIRMSAFHNLGLTIFDNKNISDTLKYEVLNKIIKKLNILLSNKMENNFVLSQNSVAYNYIYRFINDFETKNGSIQITKKDKIAFFFGAFSPFSLAHKEVAIKVRDSGCEVMLMLDDFMWKRSLLPSKIRGEIAALSVSDQLEINVYPLELPINRGNDNDIRKLNDLFQGMDKWIIVAEEAILKDDFYSLENKSMELFNMNHFIFERRLSCESSEELPEKISRINGKIIRLKIDNDKMRFSSKAISNLISTQGDLSSVIDSSAEKYISSFGFNDDVNRYKEAFEDISMDVETHDVYKNDLITEIKTIFFNGDNSFGEYIEKHYKKPEAGILTIRKTLTGDLMGFSVYSKLKNDLVYDHFRDREISSFVYDNSTGSILLINGIFYDEKDKTKIDRLLLTETLANALAHDYEYCLYHDNIIRRDISLISKALTLYGFIKLRINGAEFPVFHVSMKNVSTLYLDIKPLIKSPYSGMKEVTDMISLNRERLQFALTRLSPGQLLLSFDRKMLYASLIKKICKENDVSYITEDSSSAISDGNSSAISEGNSSAVSEGNSSAISEGSVYSKKHKYGDAVCAPFGNMLFKQMVPNCITKSLHTEKIFHSDLVGFRIGASPFYLDLETQIKILASMDKPVILIDDLLDKGYRLNALNPLLWKHKVNVKKIIVGILSNKGKELMDIQGHKVEGAYIVPKLKTWFNESMLIPFLGGDSIEKLQFSMDNRKLIPSVEENHSEISNLIPSINMLLPYAKPTFVKDSGIGKVEELSKVCLEGAIEIFRTLEKIYEEINGKGLYIEKLGDVLMIPRIPDIGVAASYKKGIRVSEALESELERLIRITGKA